MSTPFQIPRPVRSNGQAAPPKPEKQSKPEVNKIKHGGGFNPNFGGINLTIIKTDPNAAGGNSNTAAPAGPVDKAAPGSEFGSNEDIRAFSEHLRKAARRRAVERALDAEHLESVLRHIPTSDGVIGGAWMRARRVSRHAKKIASAEQLIAKAAAALYAQFEREYEAELRKVGRARPQQQRRPFGFS